MALSVSFADVIMHMLMVPHSFCCSPIMRCSALSPAAPLMVGARNAGGTASPTAGNFYQARLQVDGGTVAHFDAGDFTLGDSDTDTAVGSGGKTWTIHAAASEIKDEKRALVG